MNKIVLIAMACVISFPAMAQNPKISSYAVTKITQNGYPKLYAQWGGDWVNKINSMTPKAAEVIAQNPSCDKVDLVDISTERSVARKKIVFYGDCINGQRFYVSDIEIAAGAPVQSKQDKTAGISDAAALEACVTSVKNRLNYPSTFSQSIFSSGVYRAPTGNLVAEFDFKAKNAFNLELKHHVRCVIDDQGLHEPEITEVRS